MSPINPDTPSPRPPMAPPYVDENPELDMVQQGLDEAESETRDAVADAYEVSARSSDNPEEELNDIDYAENEVASIPTEIAAIHDGTAPSSDENEEE